MTPPTLAPSLQEQLDDRDATIHELQERLQDRTAGFLETVQTLSLEIARLRRELKQKPPPGVPLADIRPVVEAAKQCMQFKVSCTIAEQNLISTIKVFTAKHRLP